VNGAIKTPREEASGVDCPPSLAAHKSEAPRRAMEMDGCGIAMSACRERPIPLSCVSDPRHGALALDFLGG